MKDTDAGHSSALPGNGGQFRILHISDIHFGRGFQPAKWSSLIATAAGIKPDLVVVTGDFVNSPWRWQTRSVRKRLKEFSDEVRTADGSPSKTLAVAGNHDTRWSGILPVRWLLGVALLAEIFGIGAWWLSDDATLSAGAITWRTIAGICALVLLVAIVLRAFLCSNFVKSLGGKLLLDEPYVTTCGRVGFLPLDSSTLDVSWARGCLSDKSIATIKEDITKAQAAAAGGSKRPVWIALVHHHPLPMPYDSQHERMMVMDNAGAVLDQLTRAEVRLVLHGHKHHQHFARISIKPAKDPYRELAVLSAGTPTQGRSAGSYWHGFNVVDVRRGDRVFVTPYIAPAQGGSFESEPEFELAPSEYLAHEKYRGHLKTLPASCGRMMCVVEITDLGDARFDRQLRGVKASLPLSHLHKPFVADLESGLVEAFIARSLLDHGPEVTARVQRSGRGHMEACIVFNGGLQQGIDPIAFESGFYGNNAFAMNRWQFQQMYPSRKDFQEHLRWRVPDEVAVRELTLHIQFPRDLPLPRRFNLKVGAEEADQTHWETLSEDHMMKVELQNVVQARIAYPVPGAVYEISWGVPEGSLIARSPMARGRSTTGSTRAQRLREWLASLLDKKSVPLALGELLERVEGEARQALGDPLNVDAPPFDIALFAYEEKSKSLAYLAGSHSPGDVRRKALYPFGLGAVGRAFKAAEVSYFRRPDQPPDEVPWTHVLPDGAPVERSNQVAEAAILAIPLVPEDAPDWPYGVIAISTDRSDVSLKTTNTASDFSVETFATSVRSVTMLFETIKAEQESAR